MPRFVSLLARVRREHPHLSIERIQQLVDEHRILVAGKPIFNVHALVAPQARVVVDEGKELRGTLKLRAALHAFSLDVHGATALDLGACTGGFTTALLDAGARKVYAVDAGAGQLLGSLRLDARVVNLERTNLAALDDTLIGDAIDVVTADLSYVSLANAFAQLDRVSFANNAHAVALVKPQFELGLSHAPRDDASVDAAIARAQEGLVAAGWSIVAAMRSPLLGARGSVEGFVHAMRVTDEGPP